MNSKGSLTPAKKRPRTDRPSCTKPTEAVAENKLYYQGIGANNHSSVLESRNSAQSHHHTARNNQYDLARGEGVTTRLALQREQERQIWCNETDRTTQSSTHQPNIPTYRTVLAKRGLLVKDTLGAGSYSKVKLAHYLNRHDNPIYPNRVAVKIIDRAGAPKDFQEKFLPRELEVWPKLKHPNIVQMLDFFQEHTRVYIILEYCECGDALRYVQSTGALSEDMGRNWVHQVADAVRYLHEMNITHRDLKLENILIDSKNNVKLCDFGFVKTCCSEDLSRTFCGSKSYAAPEILKGEPYEPKKADIWAIGVILYIMVTARMPFDESKGNQSLLSEHRALELQWPRGRRAVSTQCKAMIIFCFKYYWAERPNIHQVLNHQWFKAPLTMHT